MLAKNRISGIYSDIQIQKLIDQKNITSGKNISIDQIQPASLDLSLGNKAWRVKSSFLPGIKNKVSNKVPRLSMHEIDLNNLTSILDFKVYDKATIYWFCIFRVFSSE